MLSSISWAEYFTYLTIGIGLYYSVWLFRYYPTLRMRRPDQVKSGPDSTKHEGSGEQLPGTAGTGKGEVHRGPDQADHAGPDKAREAPQKGPLRLPPPVEAGVKHKSDVGAEAGQLPGAGEAASGRKAPGGNVETGLHAAILAREVMEKIDALLARAVQEHMAEGQLVYAFQQLLDAEPYRQLIHTEFYGRIIESIRGTLEKTGSIPFDAERIKGLWVR